MTKSHSKVAIAILPPGPADAPAAGDSPEFDPGSDQAEQGVGQLCLPEDVVATADDNDQKVAPDVGDEVRFDCVGRVTRVDDGKVYLVPTEVNGTPVGDQNHHGPPDQDVAADNEEALRDLAQQADDGTGN